MISYNEAEEFWHDLKTGKFASMVKETVKGKSICQPYEVYNIMKPLFAEDDDVEKVFFLFLDSSNQIISIEKMFEGTINRTAVYPREIIKRMLCLKSNACIMVHNHPSGETKPSKEDELITAKVASALRAIDADFHDHLIVGDGYFSMNEAGLLRKIIGS